MGKEGFIGQDDDLFLKIRKIFGRKMELTSRDEWNQRRRRRSDRTAGIFKEATGKSLQERILGDDLL